MTSSRRSNSGNSNDTSKSGNTNKGSNRKMNSRKTDNDGKSYSDSGKSFIGGIYHGQWLPSANLIKHKIEDDNCNAVKLLERARLDGFDYVVTDLPIITTDSSNNVTHRTDITRLESKWWSTSIVGMMVDPPHWRATKHDFGKEQEAATTAVDGVPTPGRMLLKALTDVESSCDSLTREKERKKEATEIFWGMLEWASHMTIPAVILPPIPLLHVTSEKNEIVEHKSITYDDDNQPNTIYQPSAETCRINREGGGIDSDDDMFANEDEPLSNIPTLKQAQNTNVILSPMSNQVTTSITSQNQNHHNDASPPISINNPSAKEYARLLSTLSTSPICTTSHVQLWIRVPLTLHHLQAFQLLLARCDHAPSLGCVLYISSPLPSTHIPEMVRALHIFLGAGNIKAVSWDVSVFLTNKSGYPTLSKSHQLIFSLLFERIGRSIRVLVEGRVRGSEEENDGSTIRSSSLNSPQTLHPMGQYGGGASGRLHYIQYLRHLRSHLAETLDSEEATIETPYLDHLQSPLQPLGDHLEYQTYETFEKDPVKYKRYSEALVYALEDGMKNGRFQHMGIIKTTLGQLQKMNRAVARSIGEKSEDGLEDMNDESKVNDREVVEVEMYQVIILVVGAGRGPLVREAIQAVAQTSSTLANSSAFNTTSVRTALHAKVVAIEKNPSAIMYLQSLKKCDVSWNGGQEYNPYNNSTNELEYNNGKHEIIVPGTSNVTVIGCDMRHAASDPVLKKMIQHHCLRADIVVSELLGSFGDNELSPECLDGVQRCGLLKDNCVSIPQSYTSYIAPISSVRLHNEARSQSFHPLHSNDGPGGPSMGLQRAMETPYVVRPHAVSQTHLEQPCWTFTHPHHRRIQGLNRGMSEDPANCVNSLEGHNYLSAEAVKGVNNDRRAHVSFHYDRTHGAGTGCGYGASNHESMAKISATSDEASLSILNDSVITIHGFLGTFHSILYKSCDSTPTNDLLEGVESTNTKEAKEKYSVISIAPSSFSNGMFSWFPLYFPLKEPLRVPPGAVLNCSLWRRSDENRVWYEWCAEVVSSPASDCDSVNVYCLSSIHNPGGRSYHVRL